METQTVITRDNNKVAAVSWFVSFNIEHGINIMYIKMVDFVDNIQNGPVN